MITPMSTSNYAYKSILMSSLLCVTVAVLKVPFLVMGNYHSLVFMFRIAFSYFL